MKKSIKLISLFVIALITMVLGNEVAYAADTVPNTFKASTYQMTTKPLGFTGIINVKKTTNGKYIYCLNIGMNLPNTNITYTKANQITDIGLAYIIASGYSDKTDNEFFATQAAAWIYLVDTNQMKDTSSNYVKRLKEAAYSSKNANDAIAKDIKNLLETAKRANQTGKKTYFEILTNEDDIKFTLKNGVYTSNVIVVSTNLDDDYSIMLYNQPEGTKVNRVNNGFTITIPEENVKVGTTTIGAVLHHDTTSYSVYKYTPSNSTYQSMAAAYEDTLYFNDDISISITKEEEPEDPTVMVISKQDITNEKELPGATLVIRDSDGDIVEKWVSTTKPRKIRNLEPGKYTLEEIVAPDGYVLSTEKISFRVREDGKTKTVVMYNTPEEPEETIVSISKQDITNKEELPGATLIVRDENGKELYKWVSSDKPYIIKGLEEGKYTLEEITAPDGFKLSSEKITFEVKNNGVVTEVVMFNTPEATEIIVVPPTGLDATTISYIFGGLIVIIGSVLIYKNVKKEQ